MTDDESATPANQSLTHLYFLLDRSGSMQSIKLDTIGGFEAFIAEQRETEGDCRVTLNQFDTDYEEVYADVPVADVPPLDLQPRGSTALHDAMGRMITERATALARLPKAQRPGSIICAIMTDGGENSSREWSAASIKALVEQQTAADWQFLYMGADQDAVEVGKGLGVSADNSVTYARGKSRQAMTNASGKISRLRQARMVDPGAAIEGFTEAERVELGQD